MVVYALLKKKKKGEEEEDFSGSRERDEGGRGGTKEVWLTSLILFPHTDAFQIDLHTAKCPLSLGLAVAGALECTKPEEKQGEAETSGGRSG